jgi:hypothetical protein
MFQPPLRLPAALLLCALAGKTPQAADLNWTNGLGDGFWGSSGNWNPAQLPVAGDSLRFTSAGATGLAGNPVTSTLDLNDPDPFGLLNLFFENTPATLTHHLDLAGRRLRVNGEFRVGYGFDNTLATISGGELQFGESPSQRAGNVAVGYRGAGSTTAAINAIWQLGEGASLTAYTGAFDVGRRFANTSVNTVGEADWSAASSVFLDATRIYLGSNSNTGGGQGVVGGTLRLPTGAGSTAVLTTPSLWISHGDPVGNTALTSELTLGPSTEINTDELAVARWKAKGILRFATGVSGGTLTVGGRSTTTPAWRVAWNTVDTGTTSEGTVDLLAGTLNATVGELAIGVHNSNSGGARGTFLMGLGTLLADQLTLARPDNGGNSTTDANTTAHFRLNGGLVAVNGSVTDGNGTSLVQVDAGTMNVGDAFRADTLRVGYNNITGRNVTALLDVNGPVQVGTGTQIVDIGRAESPNASPIEQLVATANFADAPTVDIQVADLRLGTVITDGNTNARGVLHLSAGGVNSLTATTLTVGNSGASGNTGGPSEIHFGGFTNTVRVNTFHIGRQKSNGIADILPGGVLDLAGRTVPEANLFIGNNDPGNTGTTTFGLLDTTAGEFRAQLNQLVVGRHHSGSGNGKGTFHMGAGLVQARSVLLANPNSGGTSSAPLNTAGTVRIEGGELRVNGDTLDGGGSSQVEVVSGLYWSRGRFEVDVAQVGAAAGPEAVLALVPPTDALRSLVTDLTVEPTGVLQLAWKPGAPAAVATNLLFAAGSRLDAVPRHATPSTSLDAREVTTWVGATNTWDAAHLWDNGLPGGYVIPNGATQTVLVALGSLTDHGVTSASADWDIQITTGATNQVDLVRAGPPLAAQAAAAQILAAEADVTRPGDLSLGDAPDSGADATLLLQSAGVLRVEGGLADAGGRSAYLLHGGTALLQGGVDVDFLRVGYNGLSGTLQAGGGTVRVGDGSEPLDMGRRDSGVVTTFGSADFSATEAVELRATEIRLGTLTVGANGTSQGILLLPTVATAPNLLAAGAITLGDSVNAANPTESQLHLGGGETTLQTDLLAIGRRKSRGRVHADPGAVLRLEGASGPEVDLLVGVNDSATATVSLGMLDLSQGTLFASLDEVTLGLHGSDTSGNPGSGKGTLHMGGGAVSARQVWLARTGTLGSSSQPQNTTGHLQISGGVFATTQDIADGGGVSRVTVDGGFLSANRLLNLDHFDLSAGAVQASVFTNNLAAASLAFTGGTLSVGVLAPGLPEVTQSGGTLDPAPWGHTTVVHGGYHLQGGAWAVEYQGVTNTLVDVRGALTLGPGSTLELSQPAAPATNHYVIARYTSLSGTFAFTNQLAAGWTVDYHFEGRNEIALVQAGSSPLAAFSVTVENGDVVVRWTTVDETDLLGFHLEREFPGPVWVRLNAALIPAQGGPGGHDYAYIDTSATPGERHQYRVVLVRVGDVEEIVGPYDELAEQVLLLATPTAVSGNTATLKWDSNAGETYTLWRSPSLTPPNWTPIATALPATPPQNTHTDPTATGDRFYYRVERE